MRTWIGTVILTLVALSATPASPAEPSCDPLVNGRCAACKLKVRFSGSTAFSVVCPNMPPGTKQIELDAPVSVDGATQAMYGVHYSMKITRGAEQPLTLPGTAMSLVNHLPMQVTDTFEDAQGGNVRIALTTRGFWHNPHQQYTTVSTIGNEGFVAIRLVSIPSSVPPQPPVPPPVVAVPDTAPSFWQGVFDFVRKHQDMLKILGSLGGGVGVIVTAVRWRWRRLTNRKMAEDLRDMTFEPGGLRMPVQNISRGRGAKDDCDYIRAKLQATSEVESIASELERHRTRIRKDFGEGKAGILDDQVKILKAEIRQDLDTLSRMDPQDKKAVALAVQIRKQMETFNKEIRKLHDLIFPPRSGGNG